MSKVGKWESGKVEHAGSGTMCNFTIVQTLYRPRLTGNASSYTNAIGMEGLIELYRVDIAYNGFIEMRLSAFSS